MLIVFLKSDWHVARRCTDLKDGCGCVRAWLGIDDDAFQAGVEDAVETLSESEGIYLHLL